MTVDLTGLVVGGGAVAPSVPVVDVRYPLGVGLHEGAQDGQEVALDRLEVGEQVWRGRRSREFSRSADGAPLDALMSGLARRFIVVRSPVGLFLAAGAPGTRLGELSPETLGPRGQAIEVITCSRSCPFH